MAPKRIREQACPGFDRRFLGLYDGGGGGADDDLADDPVICSDHDDDDTQPSSIVQETPGLFNSSSVPFRSAPAAEPPLLYARDQADAILNGRAQASAEQHLSRRHNSNIVRGELATMYPHLERYYDMEEEGDGDGDALARIDWSKCNGIDLWNILQSKHLACGKTSSMAFSFRECVKKLKDVVASSGLKSKFEEVLKDTNDKHLPTQASVKQHFLEALSVDATLSAVRTHMAKYHSNKRIRIKDGLFPKFTDVQTNKVRIAAFMVSACTQRLLHTMQNPSQSRAAVDDNETRAVTVRTTCYQEFTDIVNSVQSPDYPIIDMTAFNGITVCCAERLGAPMTLLDVSRAMSDLKREMSKVMSNFNQSGRCENGADDYERDCDFYDNFIRCDPVMFAVYLSWDHGRNIPAWNSTLLPPENQMDIGVGRAAVSDSSSKKKGRSSVQGDIVDPGRLSDLIQMQTKFFDYALGGRDGPSTQSSASSSSTRVSDFEHQITQLQRLRADTLLSPEQRQKVDDAYNSIIDKICLTTSDLTS